MFERVRGVRVRVNAHRGAAGMMTHEEKLVRGRAILAAYRAWLRCEAVRGDARRCVCVCARACACVCVCVCVCACVCVYVRVLTLNPKP